MTRTTVTELINATRIDSLLTSPGGRIVAKASSPDAKGTSYRSRLVELDGGAAVGLTRGAASVGSAALADNGATYFTAKRVGEDGAEAEDAALWGLPPRGEAAQLAARPGGFGRIEVRGSVLIAELDAHSQATDEASHAELSKARSDAKTSAVLHAGFPLRYWNTDLGPGRSVLAVAALPEDLDALAPLQGTADAEEEPGSVLDFRWALMPAGRLEDWEPSAEGDAALVTMGVSIPGQLGATELWVVDLATGAAPRRVADAEVSHSMWGGPISPDGKRALVGRESHWTPTSDLDSHTLILDLATGATTELWPGHDYWLAPAWLDDHTVVASSDDHGRGSLWIGGSADHEPRRLAGGPEDKLTFDAPKVAGGRVITTVSAIDVAPYPVAVDPASGQVTELPTPATQPAQTGTLTEVTATAEDGTVLRAWLRLPAGEGPHPLVVFAHGGPWGSWNAWTYRWNPNPFVDAGFAVLLPDPAISTGYGQAMIARGQQQLGGAPYTDILALTDATIARPDVDETRTAFAGGSYGGYMANWVAGHTGTRFACIVTHASLWDTESMGRTTDNAEWAPAMAQQYAQYSPHHYAEAIEVPMLVIHGDKDYRVPIGQGQTLWYDLLTRSATPLAEDGSTQHRFLYFPDEGHWVARRGNAELWYETFIAFLAQHTLGEGAERPSTLG
ncbi:MAG: prolyl oligopeptidase family serine peptidase [Arthrobacter sp.]|jgi:dipeptidyl aminopeptidase/acylaminoacyl peptidase|nr:prolyl oligopeptidase family serine peptidase [Arthrobacter sp.]